MDEDFRVEVELNDAEHGYSLRERLRALDLDDRARDRLGRGVVVTRDGSRLFLYAATESQAREAGEVVAELARAEGVTPDVRLTRWHEVEEAWKDAVLPLPASDRERAAEYVAREAAETAEAQAEGQYDWSVVAHLPSREAATELAARLRAEGHPVTRRWRYLMVGAVTQERATALADRLRAELPADADVRVEVDLSDLARSPLQFLPF